MKNLRKISPYISFILVVLMLAGSSGYTLIVHSCQKCMFQEVISSIELESNGSGCCCEIDKPASEKEQKGFIFRHDCCSLKMEQLMTSELVKTEAQTEIIPFFAVSAHIAVFPQEFNIEKKNIAPSGCKRDGRDLTTLYCQILS